MHETVEDPRIDTKCAPPKLCLFTILRSHALHPNPALPSWARTAPPWSTSLLEMSVAKHVCSTYTEIAKEEHLCSPAPRRPTAAREPAPSWSSSSLKQTHICKHTLERKLEAMQIES